MTWVRLDDASATHPKLLKAGMAAYGLWVAGLCYCNRYLTDGVIPKEALDILLPGTPPKALLDLAHRLCTNRVRPDGKPSWIEEPEQYRVHDFDKYQPSKEEIEAERHAARHRQKESRSRRRHAVTTDEVTPVVTVVSQPPIPSHPIPSRPSGAAHHTASEREDGWIADARDRIMAAYPPSSTGGVVDAERAIFEMQRMGMLFPDGEPVTHPKGITVAGLCASICSWKLSDPWTRQGGFAIPKLRNYLDRGTYLSPAPAPGSQSRQAASDRRAAGAHSSPQPSRVVGLDE